MSQICKSTYTKIKRKTTTFEIKKKQKKSLKSKVSHGYDEISTKLLK